VIGGNCAAATLAKRADDGLAEIDGPFTEGTLPGEYRFTVAVQFRHRKYIWAIA
jgi:hypothetical protein